MLTEENVKKLWVKMTRIYGHKWISNFGDSDDGTWFHALKDLPIELIKDGLEACLARSDPWPPSLPEFRNLCLRVPSLEETINDLLNSDTSNPIANNIRKTIGPWSMSHKTEKELRRLIKGFYDRAVDEQSMIEKQKRLN